MEEQQNSKSEIIETEAVQCTERTQIEQKNIKSMSFKELCAAVALELQAKEKKDEDQQQQKSEDPKAAKNIGDIILTIVSILGGCAVIVLAYFTLKQNGVFGKEEAADTFKDASSFYGYNYAGYSDRIQSTVENILQKGEWIKKFSHSHLTNSIDAANMAYFLSGSSGTGKTHFTQVVAARADLAYRSMHARTSLGEEKYSQMQADGTLLEYLRTQPSRVKYMLIKPSDIMNKFFGGSEEKIKYLFDNSEALLKNKKCEAVMIVFDEAEAFFTNRELNMRGSGSTAQSSVSSEFLTRISATPSEWHNIHLFAITNLEHLIDPAFKRRFGIPMHFEGSSSRARMILIRGILPEKILSEDALNNLVLVTKGCTLAYVGRKIKMCIEYTYHTKIRKFYYDKFVETVIDDRKHNRLDL
ncbi:hypothetical protein ENBRE01_0240 [Enteropsectra breve]|nr:hypothetical protein ENBRE01_0240 [Enteropsectra breve]